MSESISISKSTDPIQPANFIQSPSRQESEHGLTQSQHGRPQLQPNIVMSSPTHPVFPLPPSPRRSSQALETRLAHLERFKQRMGSKRTQQLANTRWPSSTHTESSSSILPCATSAAVMLDPSPPLPTPAELKPTTLLPASTPAPLEHVSSPPHQQTQSSSSAPPTQLSGDILDLSFDSDDEYTPPLLPEELITWYATEEKQLILATEAELLSRQLHMPLAGSKSPANWICRPEQRHISHVAQDRDISHSFDDILPHYAISPAEMKYFHSFLESRYRFNDLREYQHLLAVFRKTQAVEAVKSSQRYGELEDLGRIVHELALDINSTLEE